MTIEHVARWIRRADRVVYLVGAGLSVPSGIRAYRSGKNAVWGEHVLEWGTRQRFLDDPLAWWKTFWLGAHGELLKTDLRPNAGHEALVSLVARGPNDLVISEVMPAPLAAITQGQWVEINNPGAEDQNIAGLRLESTSGAMNPFVMPADTVIGSQAFMVFGQSTDPSLNGDAGVALDHDADPPSLDATGLDAPPMEASAASDAGPAPVGPTTPSCACALDAQRRPPPTALFLSLACALAALARKRRRA